jgi:hypothetical protein
MLGKKLSYPEQRSDEAELDSWQQVACNVTVQMTKIKGW